MHRVLQDRESVAVHTVEITAQSFQGDSAVSIYRETVELSMKSSVFHPASLSLSHVQTFNVMLRPALVSEPYNW